MALHAKVAHWLRITIRTLRNLVFLTSLVFLLVGSTVPHGGLASQVQFFTRQIEFDFATWTLDAAAAKLSGWALSLDLFLPAESQSALVLAYLEQVELVNALRTEILLTFANPDIPNPETATEGLQKQLEIEQLRLESLSLYAEAVLQAQLIAVINDVGLETLGQVLPPSLYQVSDVPFSLIVSPRDEIRRSVDVALLPGMETDDIDHLELNIFNELDHAALVVPVGGIGTYPTMVMQTTNLIWLTEVIAHEWVHNFLTLRPLGINYYTNDELRTINETVASLAGKELGLLILQRYYPKHVPPPPVEIEDQSALAVPEPDPNAFDFRAEMRITRVEVERLLAEGKIEAAEDYMETRRGFFWDNGYLIRKLNQAYFAFYGAYNDEPGGGAAGEDPVGPAVVALRAQFDSLADFLNKISWVNSFESLLALLNS